MRNLIGDLKGLVESTYSHAYNDLLTNTDTLLKDEFCKALLGLIEVNMDNARYKPMLSKVLESNFSAAERDQFLSANEVSYALVNELDTYLSEEWPQVIQSALTSLSVDDIRKVLTARVYSSVGKLRSRVITVIPGQELLYAGKMMEVQRYSVDSNPVAANYPLLSLDIGRLDNEENTITSLAEAHSYVSLTIQNWTLLACAIEPIKSAAIAFINDPVNTNIEELYAAANIDWPAYFPSLFPELVQE